MTKVNGIWLYSVAEWEKGKGKWRMMTRQG